MVEHWEFVENMAWMARYDLQCAYDHARDRRWRKVYVRLVHWYPLAVYVWAHALLTAFVDEYGAGLMHVHTACDHVARLPLGLSVEEYRQEVMI